MSHLDFILDIWTFSVTAQHGRKNAYGRGIVFDCGGPKTPDEYVF